MRPASLKQGRRRSESLMTDTCTITRAGSGTGPWNEGTGQYDPPEPTMVYAGKCRIQIRSIIAPPSKPIAGDNRVVQQECEWQGPVLGTEDIAINDVVRVDSAVLDPSLVGREFTVFARHEKSQATARRLWVIEVTG